ncbi:hypothetical protein ACIOVB_17190, partial [Pseudomonas sp. NPDC087639]
MRRLKRDPLERAFLRGYPRESANALPRDHRRRSFA